MLYQAAVQETIFYVLLVWLCEVEYMDIVVVQSLVATNFRLYLRSPNHVIDLLVSLMSIEQ